MTSFKKVLLASLLAGLGFAAMADNGPNRHGPMDPAKMAAQHTQRLADLKGKLNIDAAQEAAWATFTASMAPPTGMRLTKEQRAALKAEMAKLSTPERIDKMKALRAERQSRMNTEIAKREDAAKAFYAVLRPEQKTTFDAAHKAMMERMGGKGGRGGPGGRHNG